MKTAIITGASSGLGEAFVLAAVDLFPEIEYFWLISRRTEALQVLTEKLSGKNWRILSMDLGQGGVDPPPAKPPGE